MNREEALKYLPPVGEAREILFTGDTKPKWYPFELIGVGDRKFFAKVEGTEDTWFLSDLHEFKFRKTRTEINTSAFNLIVSTLTLDGVPGQRAAEIAEDLVAAGLVNSLDFEGYE